MNNEQATIEKKSEAHENHEASRSVESPEESRQQMMTEAEKEVAGFQSESADEISQTEARAEKDGLAIDNEDKKELQKIAAEVDAAKEELQSLLKNEEKNPTKIIRSGQEKIHTMFSAGKQESAEYVALNSLLMKQENGQNIWKSAEEIDAAGVEGVLENIDRQETFDKAKEKIKGLHAEGKNTSSAYLELHSQIVEVSGQNAKWKNVSEIDADKIKKMIDATDLSSQNELPETQQESVTDLKSQENMKGEHSKDVDSVENISAMKERVTESPELLSEKEASKKLLMEERIKLAQEIREQRKASRSQLRLQKTRIDFVNISSENMEGERGDSEYGKFSEMQGEQASATAERIMSSGELSQEDAQMEKENVAQLIENSEKLKSIKEKIKEHYDKAEGLARERFDTLNRSLENVMKRNNVFLVHKIEERESLRHNANSNVSSETTYQDDIDIMLALEPSVSASSVTPGEKANLWPGASGFLFGGGQIGEASTGDAGTHAYGIKKRGGEKSSIEEIDKVVGRKDESSRKTYERFGEHVVMNEVVVNNPEVFGFFQHAEQDENGRFWAGKVEDVRHLSEEMPEFFGSGIDKGSNRHNLKAIVDSYKERFAVASKRNIPLYIMTLDRNVYECINVNDDGTIEVGKQITPEEVAMGHAGLSLEKRREIGEKLLENKIFKKQETQDEARKIIDEL